MAQNNSVVMNINNVAAVATNGKEEMTMAQTTLAAEVVLGFAAEKLETMKVEELKDAARLCGVKVSGKKADLIERLTPFCKKELEVKIVSAPVAAKAWKDMTPEEKLADAKLSKWDKLIKAVASEYVKQSLGVKWALFYKNTKSTTTKAEYLVKTKKLWGATSKVIKSLYGEKNCNEDTIRQTLNAMVARGYLNFQKVQGRDGINIIFNATKDQMNAMYKLSK